MKAKDAHSSLLEWLPLLAFCFFVLAAFWAWLGAGVTLKGDSWQWLQEDRWKICGGGFAFWVALAFWYSFCQSDDKREALEATKESKPSLNVEFISPSAGHHSQILLRVFKIKVTNLSKTAFADNVSASILSIKHAGWSIDATPQCIRELRLPFHITRTCQDYRVPEGFHSFLNPGDSVFFDVAALSLDERFWHISLPPFKAIKPGSRWSSSCEFVGRDVATQPEAQEFELVLQISSKASEPVQAKNCIVIPGASEHGTCDWKLKVGVSPKA